MIDYQYLLKNPRLFRALTGHNEEQFRKLLKHFQSHLESYSFSYTRSGKKRIRSYGGGRKSPSFGKPSKLLVLILFYIRAYPTFDLLQIFYKIDKAALHRHIQLGLKCLELSVTHKIPLPAKKTRSMNELLLIIPELKEHLIDASEQPINRPKRNQEFYYSGKKKRHTIKRQVIITADKKIISISKTVEGKRHDKQLAEDLSYHENAPPGSVCLADLGYQGLKIDKKTVRVITPIKKKRGKNLTEGQRATNRCLSSVRIRVEHVIGHLKFNRIFSDKVRYRLNIHDQVANIVAGIYNLKLET